MDVVYQKATDQIDFETGFRCRTVYVSTENSVLHCHDYYELFLTLSDSVLHLINGREEELEKGTLIFIRKSDTHFFGKNNNCNYSFVNLAFTEEILQKMFLFFSNDFPSEKLLNQKYPPQIILDSVGVQKVLAELNLINTIPVNDNNRRSWAYKKLLVNLFYKYFSEYKNNELSFQQPLWLKKFNIEIKKNDVFSLPNAQIVEISGKSREHLSRTIKKYYGVSFTEYINNIRLNYIANSLITTDIPITDLIYDAGFENLSYAYVLFKKKFCTTPRLMRESCGN